jgi:hypothetical protein
MYNSVLGNISEKLLDKFKWRYYQLSFNRKYCTKMFDSFNSYEIHIYLIHGVSLLRRLQTAVWRIV